MGSGRLTDQEVNGLLAAQSLRRIGDYKGAGSPLECQCLECGRTVTPRISMIKSGHRGCRFCAAQAGAKRRKVSSEDAFLLMVEAGASPIEPYKDSKTPWMSQCLKCGERISPSYANVRQGHSACKYCSGKAITKEKAISIYLGSGAKPVSEFVRTNQKWPGRCLGCGGDVAPRLDDLKRGQGPCPPCGARVSSEKQKLTEEEATRRMVEAGAEPLEPWGSKKVDDPWLCRCLLCDSTITPTVHSVNSGQGPCIHCGRSQSALKRTFTHKQAVELLSLYQFQALQDYPGAGEPWLTRCENCGSEAKRSLANIQTGHGCRDCAYENNKNSELESTAEMLRRGWEPLEPYPKASEPWKCKCLNCGEVSFKRLYSLNHKGSMGCVHCSERILGTYFYLIHNSELRAFKVGVGGQRRLDDHRWQGWAVVDVWDLVTPVEAYSLEKNVLTFVREEWGLPQWLGREDMPQKGATETFSDGEKTAEDLRQLVNKLRVSI